MKVSRFAVAIICVGVVAMMASEVMAQGGGRRGGGRGMGGGMFGRGGGSIMGLMAEDKLKEELELEDEQVTKIQEFNDDARAEQQDKMQKLRDSGDFEGMRDAMTEMREEQNKAEKEFASEVFNEKQLDRYNQLRVQRMGQGILSDADFRESIGIDDDKWKEIEGMQQDFQEEMREEMRAMRDSGDFGAAREVIAEMQEEHQKEVMEALSDEQKKAWEDAKGEKFEFPERQRRQREDF